MASPSLKNSGFDTTLNNFFLTFFAIIFSTLSPVNTGTVDLFDGGPIMSVHRDTIRTIMNSKVLKAKRQEKIKEGVYSIVTSGACNNFRAVISKTKLNDDKVNISFEAFDFLNLQRNNTVRYWQTNKKNKIEFEQSNHIRHKAIEHI